MRREKQCHPRCFIDSDSFHCGCALTFSSGWHGVLLNQLDSRDKIEGAQAFLEVRGCFPHKGTWASRKPRSAWSLRCSCDVLAVRVGCDLSDASRVDRKRSSCLR